MVHSQTKRKNRALDGGLGEGSTDQAPTPSVCRASATPALSRPPSRPVAGRRQVGNAGGEPRRANAEGEVGNQKYKENRSKAAPAQVL